MIVKLVRKNNQHVLTWDVKGAHINNDYEGQTMDSRTTRLCVASTNQGCDDFGNA